MGIQISAPNVVKLAKSGNSSVECNPDVACPIMDHVEVFGKRWSMEILRLLYIDDRSFVEIQRGLPGIAPGMLSKRLKELEKEKIITRNVVSTRPLAVSYHMTDGTLRDFACWTRH